IPRGSVRARAPGGEQGLKESANGTERRLTALFGMAMEGVRWQKCMVRIDSIVESDATSVASRLALGGGGCRGGERVLGRSNRWAPRYKFARISTGIYSSLVRRPTLPGRVSRPDRLC